MIQAPRKTLTLEDFLQLPETKPASEYLDGQMIQKPMPQGEQSAIQGEMLPTVNGLKIFSIVCNMGMEWNG
jgi:Uma2 family endonuclease